MLEALNINTVAAPLFDLRLALGSKDISEVKRPASPAPKCVATIVMHEGIRQYTEGNIYEMPDGVLIAIPRKGRLVNDYEGATIFPADNPALKKAQADQKDDKLIVLDIADVGSYWGSTSAGELDIALLKNKIEPGLQKVKELLKADGIDLG